MFARSALSVLVHRTESRVFTRKNVALGTRLTSDWDVGKHLDVDFDCQLTLFSFWVDPLTHSYSAV